MEGGDGGREEVREWWREKGGGVDGSHDHYERTGN